MFDFCDPMECNLPGSSVPGISEARILEGVAISFSRVSSQPRDQIWVSYIAGGFFSNWSTMGIVFFFFFAFIAFKIWVNLLAHHCITVVEYSEFDCILTFTKKKKMAPLVAQLVKNLPAMWETWVWSLGWGDPLEKGMATHSSILARRIPWTV